MYHKASIAKLSNNQISRLLNGHSVRVKHGQGHVVHLSKDQMKKHIKASTKGSGFNLSFDPYQIDNHHHLHGQGLMSHAKKALKHAGHFVKSHKEAFRPLVQHAKQAGHNAIADASMYALEQGVDPSLVGVYNNMAHEAIHPSGGSAKSFFRSPAMKVVRKALRPLGQTLLNDTLGLANQGLDQGMSQASMGMSGMGMMGRVGLGIKKPKKHVKKHGGALYPAGGYYN